MQLPTIDEIEELHKKNASTDEMFAWVYTHCQAVWSVAQQLIEQNDLKVDPELVKVGCLVHDIGVYTLFNDVDNLRPGEKYLTHGIRGEELLRTAGFDEAIQRFASHHTGVGITKEAIEKHHLPLPAENYTAETPEERLVMYADKFHSKDNPLCFNSYDWYRAKVAQFGEDYAGKFDQLAEEFGKPDLIPLAKKYGHRIRS